MMYYDEKLVYICLYKKLMAGQMSVSVLRRNDEPYPHEFEILNFHSSESAITHFFAPTLK